jgi:hypothetical protein
MRKVLGAKALILAVAAAAIIFNRGNATVGLYAALIAAVAVLGIEAYANREYPIALSLNIVGALLVIPTALFLTKMPAEARFYLVVVVFTFVQLIGELIYNTRNGWFKKSNIDHLINFALHAIIWAAFVWLNLDSIGALGAFGTYCALLAVHFGIDAAGPKREG